MEAIITSKIIEAISQGNIPDFLFGVFVLIFLWLKVGGLQKSVEKLTETVEKSFAKGEQRFTALENSQKEIEHRLTVLETHKLTQGG